MGMFAARNGSIAGFNPAKPSWIDKAGLVGDILTDTPATKTRLDEDFAFNQAQYQAQHPAPMNVGGNLLQIDPLTGAVKTLFAAPPDTPAIAKNAAYLNTVTPGSGDAYLKNFAANGGGQGPGMITVNGQQMMRAPGAAPTPTIHPDAIARLQAHPEEAAMFDQQFGAGASAQYLKGGAAPATGPGGFPLYPSRH